MVSIKKIFGSSGDASVEDGGDLRHRSSRTSLDRSGKEGEAKSKNDELAARLGGGNKSSSENLGHRKSLSNSSNTGLTSNTDRSRTDAQRKNDELASGNRSSTSGYNTEADHSSPSRSAGAAATGLGAGAVGAGAVGHSTRDSTSLENTPHAVMSGDRPIVGAIPVHEGKGMSSTNNPEFVLGGASTGNNIHGQNHTGPASGGTWGTMGDSLRDNSNKESFDDPSHHRNRDSIGSAVPTSTTNTTTTSPRTSTVPSSPPNLERTGTGRLSKSASGRGFENPHESGHLAGKVHQEFDPKLATHDHQHLQHVTHREVRHVEIEEVERQREVDRHIHHVQTHVQPVIDKKVLPEQIRENVVAPTEVHERHSSTAEDVALFESLATQHRNTESHRAKERTVVDLGEKVVEKVHHHVHHVTQPVIEQEIVERHRIHTVIPVHHVTHEAPIIHKSSTHAPVALEDFLKGGGKLDSHIDYNNVGLLPDTECERTVDGVAEKLISELGLGGSSLGHSHSHGTTGTHSHGTTGATGTTGTHSNHGAGYVSNDGDVHKSKVGQLADNATPNSNNNNSKFA